MWIPVILFLAAHLGATIWFLASLKTEFSAFRREVTRDVAEINVNIKAMNTSIQRMNLRAVLREQRVGRLENEHGIPRPAALPEDP